MSYTKRERVILFLASAGYSGYFPFASGTVATAFPAIPVYLLVSLLSPVGYGVVTALLLFACVYLSQQAEKILHEKDPHKVTLDEVLGFLVTMFALAPSLKLVIAGFFIFRFFDVAKIFPARQLEDKAPGGWGVTLDDVMAGVWSHLVIRVLMYFHILS